MTAHRDELGVVCTHGHLERVCPLCELTAERDALAELVREAMEDGYDIDPHDVWDDGPSWAERARTALAGDGVADPKDKRIAERESDCAALAERVAELKAVLREATQTIEATYPRMVAALEGK